MHTLQWPTTPGHKWHLTTPTTTALLICLPTPLTTFRWAALQAVSFLAARLNPATLQGPIFLSFAQFNFLVPAENTRFFLLGTSPWQCSLLLRQCFPESCPWSEGKREKLLPACLITSRDHITNRHCLWHCSVLRREAKPGVQVLDFIRPTTVSERNKWAFGNKLFELLKTHDAWKAVLLWLFSTCFSWPKRGPCKHHLCCNASLPLGALGLCCWKWWFHVNISFHLLKQMRTFLPQLFCQVDVTTGVMLINTLHNHQDWRLFFLKSKQEFNIFDFN